jgi:DNA-binding MarR family transcriptional regulator
MPEPRENVLSGTLCFELRRASGALMVAMTNAFARSGLKPSEAMLMTYIGANPGCTQSEIARTFGAKAANLVPLIARLERDGLVERTRSGGRAIAISLSTSGTAMLEDVEAGFQELEQQIVQGLDPRHREQVIDALQQVCKAACHYQAGQDR